MLPRTARKPRQLRRRPPPKPAPAKRATAKRHTPADKRYTQLQTQLTEQQKKLSGMQEQVEKNRSDLEETSIQRVHRQDGKYKASELATANGQVLRPSPARARIQTTREILNNRGRTTKRQNPVNR